MRDVRPSKTREFANSAWFVSGIFPTLPALRAAVVIGEVLLAALILLGSPTGLRSATINSANKMDTAAAARTRMG
jgi:hypothetical protein